MARNFNISRRSTNVLLDYLAANVDIGDSLPSEARMTEIAGTSRTVVRSVLGYFTERGLIEGMQQRQLRRKPGHDDYFEEAATQSGAELIQKVLMERIYRQDLPPGTEFAETELARAAGVSTNTAREFLLVFSRYGLIEKKPRGGWRLCAFDRAYAEELAQARELFEYAAVASLAEKPVDDPSFARVGELLARHEALGATLPEGHADFPALDREFHTFLIGQLNNRFAENLNDIVSLVFHYHYQWDKHDEMPRNIHAVEEHLAILRALARRDAQAALAAMRVHMNSARATMLRSLGHLPR